MNNINWKLIFQLSLFGFVMSFATVWLVPEKLEPVFWLAIFVICAYVVAKQAPSKYFLHGFLISIFNSVWITIAHVLFSTAYIANHPNAAKMNASMPLFMQQHQRIAMLLMGLPFGIAFGIVLGLFCFIASKIVKK
ncbi:MAG TPA: hypothetical protein VKT28_11830 [Puia sp.]|nr:hypothetical protein [Puia sp.]